MASKVATRTKCVRGSLLIFCDLKRVYELVSRKGGELHLLLFAHGGGYVLRLAFGGSALGGSATRHRACGCAS